MQQEAYFKGDNMEKVKIYVNGKEYKNYFYSGLFGVEQFIGTARKLEVEYLGDIITEQEMKLNFPMMMKNYLLERYFFIQKKGDTDVKTFYAYDNSILS